MLGLPSRQNCARHFEIGGAVDDDVPQRAQTSRLVAASDPRERGPRQNGTLKFFNNDRGFGFITPESGGKDVFVHISAIERSGLQQLAEGTKLSFETEDDRRGRGPQAVNLQIVEE